LNNSFANTVATHTIVLRTATMTDYEQAY